MPIYGIGLKMNKTYIIQALMVKISCLFFIWSMSATQVRQAFHVEV